MNWQLPQWEREILVVVLLLLIQFAEGHGVLGRESKCLHDLHESQIVEDTIWQTQQFSKINRRLNRELEGHVRTICYWRRMMQQQQSANVPIRIHVDYQLDNLVEDQREFVQDMIIPPTLTILHNTFSIKNQQPNVNETFFLPARCNESIVVRQNGVLTGEEWCASIQEMCGPHARHNFDYFLGYTTCSAQNDCVTTEPGSGLPDTDFVLYVTAKQSDSCLTESSQVASAGMCIYDEESFYGLLNRPLAAFVNFCPTRLEELDAEDDQDMGYALDTAVHELIHGLFMGRELFDLYIDDNGVPYNPVVINNNDVPIAVTSPRVVAAARDIYGCESLTAVPLEDEGGEGTAGSHWEKSIFNRELMLGGQTLQERSILSRMTLSLAEDSGWYVANFSNVGELLLGRDSGCGYFQAQDTCTQNPLPTPLQNVFCSVTQPLYECTNNYVTIGTCPSEPTGLTSNCRVLQKLLDLDCGNLRSTPPSTTDSGDFGQRVGAGTRCLPLEGGRLQRELGPNLYTKTNLGAQCFRVRCLSDQLFFYIPPTQFLEGVEVECPAGETVDLLALNLGFQSSLKVGPCPEARKICQFWGCPSVNGLTCNGKGDCYAGQCQCHLGWKGEDCTSQICTPNSCGDGRTCDGSTGECQPPNFLYQIPDTVEPVTMDVVGVAFDGYLKGCTIQSRPILVEEEDSIPTTITDEFGKYRFKTFKGQPLVLPFDLNCTDVLTSMPPVMDLYTTYGSTIISPLTTLVYYMSKEIPSNSALYVKDGLGIPLSVDINQDRDLLQVLGEGKDDTQGDRIAYSASAALTLTAHMVSAYFTLDLDPQIGNQIMQQVVDTIVDQRVFSLTNELEILQQLKTLISQQQILDTDFDSTEEQLLAVSQSVASYNQVLMQLGREQGLSSLDYLVQVVGVQRASKQNSTLAIASFRKEVLGSEKFLQLFDTQFIKTMATTFQPSQQELTRLLGVQEDNADDSFFTSIMDWLEDEQWLDLPGWFWGAIFLVLAIVIFGFLISLLRLWFRQCKKSKHVNQHHNAAESQIVVR